jgi:hypothetical protein
VVFVELGVFLEVEPLADLALPLVEVGGERRFLDGVVRRRAQVRGYDGLEDRGWHGFAGIEVR